MLKGYSWWNYKIPPMLAVAFYALYRSPDLQPVTTTLWQLGLYLVSVIGIAGFGHFFLDAFDVEEDRRGGKPNLWDNAKPSRRLLIVTTLIAASLIPWLILPNSRAGLALIGLQFLMFALYSVPPVRLKTRGFPGIVADASYAHALPAVWTWIPFSLIARIPVSPVFVASLSAWALIVGMRHLLQHQAFEAGKDEAAGSRTFAVRYGAMKTIQLVTNRILPLEIFAFAFVVIAMGRHLPILWPALVLYIAFELFRFRYLWLQQINILRPMPPTDRATIVGTLILSQFYELWLPCIILAALSFRSPSYLILFAIYMAAFRNGPVQLLRRDIPLVASRLRVTA